jgi:hypothetical protein
MAIPNIWRAAVNLAGVRLRRAERQWRRVERVSSRMTRKIERYGELISHAPSLLRARLQRGRTAVVRAQKRIERLDDHVLTPYRTERTVKGLLAAAAADGRPIIAGPWTSEVGYEALYWVPFLRWAMDRYGVSPDRIVALSRGGTQAWYGGIAERYVDIFDLADPAECAAQAASRRERGDQKQLAASDFDRELIRLSCRRLGIRDAAVWHPGLMYRLFRPFWYGDRSLDFFFRHTDFRYPAAIRTPAGDLRLPAEYVAVKFYTGPALPDTERNRSLIRELIERVAAKMPVIVLDTAWSTDEHRDYAFDAIHGVTTLRPSLDPKTNLGVQTRVIAGARQFVGTCGGLAWLAPLLGVDTLAVYEDDRYLTAHLYAARYAYRRYQSARFATLNIGALHAVGAALAKAS